MRLERFWTQWSVFNAGSGGISRRAFRRASRRAPETLRGRIRLRRASLGRGALRQCLASAGSLGEPLGTCATAPIVKPWAWRLEPMNLRHSARETHETAVPKLPHHCFRSSEPNFGPAGQRLGSSLSDVPRGTRDPKSTKPRRVALSSISRIPIVWIVNCLRTRSCHTTTDKQLPPNDRPNGASGCHFLSYDQCRRTTAPGPSAPAPHQQHSRATRPPAPRGN